MLIEGIIKESKFLWRAQVLITSSENSKKEIVIVYSQTINWFKQLDACLLLCIHEMIGEIAKYKNFRP